MTNLARYFERELRPFDLMFRNFFDTDSIFSPILNSKPQYPIDIYEDENFLNIEIAATGLKEKDIKIEVDNDILKVSYDKETKEEGGDCNYIQKGIARRSFNFGWRISDLFKLDEIVASMDDGLLSISIPRTEQKPKLSKLIPINEPSKNKLSKNKN